MYSKLLYATTVALAAVLASAQTHTDCDPTKTECPADPAVGGTVEIDFRKGPSSFFTPALGTNLEYDPANGAAFTISQDGQAPTITSTKYIFYGEIEVTLKVAPGIGIVTSVVLQSDDLDEIDWEYLGGDKVNAQTNYFSRGCVKNYGRGMYHKTPAAPQDQFITYAVRWTPEALTWLIGGEEVRTLKAESASGCDGYPQTPMQIKLGTWVGGGAGSSAGTVQWAGGKANFTDGPFVAYFQSMKITDANKGATSYVYSDKSGNSDSIKIVSGSSSTSGPSEGPNVPSPGPDSNPGSSPSEGPSSAANPGPPPGIPSASVPPTGPQPATSSPSAGPATTSSATPLPPLNYANATSSSVSSPTATGTGSPAATNSPTSSAVPVSAIAGKTSFSLTSAIVVGLALFMGLGL